MRIKNVKNVKIDAAFKDVGQSIEPLTDEEYDLLDKKIKATKTPDSVHKFDDKSDWFIGKIPESKSPITVTMKDETTMTSCSVILPGDIWTSFLIDNNAPEVDAWETYHGCKVAVVGKLVKTADGQYLNIRKYRGCQLIAKKRAAIVDDEDDDEDF